ncbi:hypothetical protein FG386_002340 [Cryptosporidium ryanae]|uniref:uncharacterized protein n=1 Tax=Cryptosporidium ryanae TaxID=515981 RepID=UPI00351A1DE8|nr:hypothetical protein FG386_002340 [Cryptosporidium ryanae]
MPGSEFLPPSKMSSRSSTKEKSKFNSVVNRNDSCDTTESDNEDDIPFIIYSEKIKINWPIFIFQKEDIVGEKDNEKDLDTEVSVDNIKFEGKYGKKIYESNILSKSHFNLKLKSVRLSFLPGFARKYIYNNNSNTLDFRFKLVINEGVGEKEEKELVDLSVKDRLDEFLTNTDCVRMEKAINTNHSLKRNYGKNTYTKASTKE